MGGAATTTEPLIVIIPGIGGSVLQTVDGTEVWGSTGKNLGALCKPERLALDKDLRPTSLLAETRPLGLILVGGYDHMTLKICNLLQNPEIDIAVDGHRPSPTARVLLFPYDFRKGMEDNGRRLANHVNQRISGTDRRVMVLAHSMGGLVAMWWWACEEGWKVCDHLYTVGTPHRGAAKALDYLGLGASLLGHKLAGITELLRGWPSTYELIPRYPMVWSADNWIYPHEMPQEAVPGFSLQRAAEAYRKHLDLENAVTSARECAPSCTFRAVRSYVHRTQSWARLSNGELELTKGAPKGSRPYIEASGGDGTVPWFSALPVSFDNDDPAKSAAFVVQTAERHRTLMTTPEALAPIAALARGTTVAARGDDDGGPEPALGLDLDDVVPAGDIPITVRTFLPDGSAVTAMTATYKDPAGNVARAPFDQDGEAWRAVIPAATNGLYDVVVEAALTKGSKSSLSVKDQIAVVGDEF